MLVFSLSVMLNLIYLEFVLLDDQTRHLSTSTWALGICDKTFVTIF